MIPTLLGVRPIKVYFMEIKGSEPQFEFDERKSRVNQFKHGVNFVEAQALWLDQALLEGRARGAGETRLLMIGQIEGRHWAAVVTLRGPVIRIISVRRARAKEIEAYESQ
jgi:uncharacterized protein